MRALFLAAIVLGIGSVTTPARADDKQICVDAHSQSQKLRRAGKLIDAQRALVICARDVCPSAVVQDCSTWRSEVEAEIPSVVIAARDEGGHDMIAVRVRIDDRVVATKLDGQPIAVDPGEHAFHYESDDGRVVDTTVLVHTSEKARPLRVDFAASPKVAVVVVVPKAQEKRRGVPAGVWILGGLGVVAAGVFAGFAVDGFSRESHLRSTCGVTHDCQPGDVANIETEYHVADVALGVSVLAFGIATTIALVHVFSKAHVGVGPARGGGYAVVGGSFW